MFSKSFRTRTRTRSLTRTRQQSIDRHPRSRAARATQAQKAQLHNLAVVDTSWPIHRLATVATVSTVATVFSLSSRRWVRDLTAGLSSSSRSSDQRDGLPLLLLSLGLRLPSLALELVGLGAGLGGVAATGAEPAGLGGNRRLTSFRSARDQMLEVIK